MIPQTLHESLLIQTAFVGDLLLSIPLLKEIRRLRPEGKITLLCRQGLGSFMIQSGLVDEVVEISKGKDTDAQSWKEASAKLRPRKFAVVYCPHESFRSNLFAAKFKADQKIGYRRWFNLLLFNHRLVRPMHLPEAMRQLALLAPNDPSWSQRLAEYAKETMAGGLYSDTQLAPVPRWAEMSVPKLIDLKTKPEKASPKTTEIVKRLDLDGKRLAVLAPGSVWNTKMWTLDGYTRVARELMRKGWRVVALGAANEREICEELQRRAPGVHVIAGETGLYESTELIAIANLVVCNDSGAMHMASAAATPTVSIFGPTVLRFGYRPWQHKSRVVQVDLECRPCGKHGSQKCPLGTHACMKKVTAEAVLTSAQELLRV